MQKTFTKARNALKPTLIEKMGIQSEVFELKKQQASIRKIAEILNQRHNCKLSYFHIEHFLKRNYEKMQYYLKDDGPAREMAKKQLEETIGEMKKLHKAAWDHYNKLKDEEDRSMQTPAMMNVMLKIIQALGKIVQDVSSSVTAPVQQKVNVLQLTQNIDKSVTHFEQKGYVMINKKELDALRKENDKLKIKVNS